MQPSSARQGGRKEAGLSDLPDIAIEAGRSDRTSEIDAGAWLAAIVENSDDAILSKTLDGVITTWKRGASRLLGYSAEAENGKRAEERRVGKGGVGKCRSWGSAYH